MDASEFLQTNQIARRLGISRSTVVRNGIERPNGWPAPIVLGRRHFYVAAEFEEYVERQKAARRAPEMVDA